MMVLPSSFFKGILLIAVCHPLITQGSGVTDHQEFGSKRIYSTTAAGEEGDLPFIASKSPSEDSDEIVTSTTFDSQRKPTPKSKDNPSFHSSTYSSWTTPRSKSTKDNSVKIPKDGNENFNDAKLFTRKQVTVKFSEGVLPSGGDDEITTTTSGNIKFVSSHSVNEYSSSTVVYHDETDIGDDDDDEVTEVPEFGSSSTSNPVAYHRNSEWKNSEQKKKSNKKESSYDNVELSDKIPIKIDKPVKESNLKIVKQFIKNQSNSSLLSPVYPDALDDNYSTINSSVIDNDKAVKNISVNNEPGSNLLEIDSVSSEVSKNTKSETVGDVPLTLNSAINKNSVTVENIDTLNKTPTIRYKDVALGIENKTSLEIPSLRDVDRSLNYGTSTKEPNYSKALKLDDSKNTIPVSQWEPSTEATSKSNKVPDNVILNMNVSIDESSYDTKKKPAPYKKPPHISSTFSAIIDHSKEMEDGTTTIKNTVPSVNADFKTKLGLSSTYRTKTFSTSPSVISDSSTINYSTSTMLPSIGNYTISLKSLSPELSTENASSENPSEENLTTIPATTISNDLIKPITGFTTRKRPLKYSILPMTTSETIQTTTNPTFTATKINFNYSTSSYQPSRRPSSIDNIILNINRTGNNSTTEASSRNVKPFVSWATRLQKLSSTTSEPTETFSSYPTILTTEPAISRTSAYQSSSVPAVFESSTESPTTVVIRTRVSTSKSSSSPFQSSTVSPQTSSVLSSDKYPESFMTSSSRSYELHSPSTTSDMHSSSENFESITQDSLSDSSVSPNLSNSSVTNESKDQNLKSHLTLSSRILNSEPTESVTLSVLSSVSSFPVKTNFQNTSEITESVSRFSSTTLSPFSSEITVTFSSDSSEKTSTSNYLSTFETVSERNNIASSMTSEIVDTTTTTNISTSTESSSSLLPSSPSYVSSTKEDEEEFLYTSESVNMFASNQTSSSLPEFSVTSSNEHLLNSTEYFTTDRNIFRSSSSTIENDYPAINATDESVLEVSSTISSISSTPSTVSSTPLSNNYFISTTESSSSIIIDSDINKSNLLTTEEMMLTTTLSPTIHDVSSDDTYDPEDDDWFINNTSNHSGNKHYSSTTSMSEHWGDEIDDDDDKSKNESHLTTEVYHKLKIDNTTTETAKSSSSESTTVSVIDLDIFGNKSDRILTSEHESFEDVTEVPVTHVKNYSIIPEIVSTSESIETTTAITPELEVISVQHTTSTSSRDNITPMFPNWSKNNVPQYIVLHVNMSLAEACHSKETLRKDIIGLFKNGTGRNLTAHQIALLNLKPEECSQMSSTNRPVSIEMTFLNESGMNVSYNLNDNFMRLYTFKKLGRQFKIQTVQLMHRQELPTDEEDGVEDQAPREPNNSLAIAAIAISCIAVVCLLLLGILLIILRKRQKGFNYGRRCVPVSLDDYSLDNISVYNSVRRKNAIRASKRSYGNPAFDDPGAPSHLLNFAGLTNFCSNRKAIDDEYSLIPMVSPKMDELPPGAETKNRYANVIPLPETRVHLSVSEGGEPLADYINANYVKGPKGVDKFYIACQAPMQSTVNDFWKMIWEQQSKIILMLTDLHENGVEKCYDYLPPSEVLDCHRLFGDYQVTLKKREVREKYVISLLQLKNLENNLWREVTHMWYMSWPHQGVPDEGASIIAFLIEARSYMRNTSGPHVVHCSPGTGRTGTVLAIDLCIRDFEANRSVDISKTVYALRRDRAGSVQTKDQYAFIYQVLNIYAAKLTGGALDSI